MKTLICAAAILIATSPLSYGKCKLDAGSTPELPDAHVASLQQMLDARANISHYMDASASFVRCAEGRGDRRTNKVLKKMHRLAKKFKQANTVFSERVAKDPSILSTSGQMVASK